MHYILIVIKDVFSTVKESLPYVIPLTLLFFILGNLKFGNNKNLLFKLKYLLLSFIISIIVYVTLISRVSMDIKNPLAIIYLGWDLFTKDGSGNIRLNLIAIENTFMLLPFTFMYLETFKDRFLKLPLKKIFLKGLMLSLTFTLTIETLQLLLKLGTTQFSDIVYNTLGGCIGTLIFYLINRKRNTI